MVELVEQLCPMPEPLPVPRGVVVALMTVILGAGLARTELQAALTDGYGDIAVSNEQFLRSSPANPEANPYAMLYQLGYLTLSQPMAGGQFVHLTCPNEKIRLALGRLLARQ